MALSRQNLPNLAGTSLAGVAKGAYTITDCEGTPDVILIGTGGELYLCDKAAAVLKEAGIKARVVSMPCWELFEEQSAEYKESVLPKAVKKRLAVEAGSTMGWHRYITDEGDVLGVDTFGASAPGGVILEKRTQEELGETLTGWGKEVLEQIEEVSIILIVIGLSVGL